jgi:hypothetical protein
MKQRFCDVFLRWRTNVVGCEGAIGLDRHFKRSGLRPPKLRSKIRRGRQLFISDLPERVVKEEIPQFVLPFPAASPGQQNIAASPRCQMDHDTDS